MDIEERQSGLSTDECPLCGGFEWTEIRAHPIKSISQYWEAMGHRLEREHKKLPTKLIECRCVQCGLHFFNPCLIGSSKLYERLAALPWYYESYKWEFDEALKFLASRKSARVLEIGCGHGAFLKQARYFSAEAKGIEYNIKAVEACRASGLEVVLGPAMNLDGQVDVLFAFQVLEHLEKPGKSLEVWIEHIAPGGYLVLAVPNQDGVLGQLSGNYLNLPPHHASLWEEKSLRFIADRFSLEMMHYLREPLSFELYATYTQSLLGRIPGRSGIIGLLARKLASQVHRSLIPYFFENALDRLAGHTHMAIYRKSG